MGDRLMEVLLGLDRIDYVSWVQYHYDLMLTSLAGYSFDTIEGGHSVTATPFAESDVALGASGVVVFGLIGGALLACSTASSGKVWRKVAGCWPRSPRHVCTAVIPWLNAGAIVQLAHVSTLAGIVLLVFAMRIIRRTRIGGRTSGLSPCRALQPPRPQAESLPAACVHFAFCTCTPSASSAARR